MGAILAGEDEWGVRCRDNQGSFSPRQIGEFHFGECRLQNGAPRLREIDLVVSKRGSVDPVVQGSVLPAHGGLRTRGIPALPTKCPASTHCPRSDLSPSHKQSGELQRISRAGGVQFGSLRQRRTRGEQHTIPHYQKKSACRTVQAPYHSEIRSNVQFKRSSWFWTGHSTDQTQVVARKEVSKLVNGQSLRFLVFGYRCPSFLLASFWMTGIVTLIPRQIFMT